jgi:hypothetical protein
MELEQEAEPEPEPVLEEKRDQNLLVGLQQQTEVQTQ